jgi:hypothetical protein
VITTTPWSITPSLFETCVSEIKLIDHKLTINEPTGDFFYDPWSVKPEFKNTSFTQILETLPFSIGEARLISLIPGTCYQVHADIDDRYHLNLTNGEDAYLIDLENYVMHQLTDSCVWHYMDAGRKHSAVNFGKMPRVQLVVRQLLSHNTLVQPVTVKIVVASGYTSHLRFIFDSTISCWLNRANKQSVIDNFKTDGVTATFDIDAQSLDSLKKILPSEFTVEIL